MKLTSVPLLFCLLSSVLVAGSAPATIDNSWDIAMIDHALATAKPDQEWIAFGDVGITPQNLRIFRERLIRQQKGAQSPGTEPEAVTPPTTFKWPSGNVYYRFDPAQVTSGAITAAKMQAVRDGLAEWTAFANVTFIEFTSPLPTNYVTIQEKTDGTQGGLSTSVGMKQTPGEQFVKIGTLSWNRGTICHEMAHVLGFYHEMQRDDRDSYVTILTANIQSGAEGNFVKVPGGSVAIGAYDFYSVMHYRRDAFSSNGQDTIQPLPAYSQFLNIFGQVYDRTLSKLERAGMAAVYGNPAQMPSAVVTNTKDGGPGSLRTAIYYAYDKSTDAPAVPTTVTFNIPNPDPNFSGGVFTIKPTFLMVAPGAGTIIDGSTQTAFTGDTNPSGPEIVVDGSQIAAQGLGLSACGFLLREMNCTIKNLVINGFNQQGVRFDGATAALNGTTASGNVINGCYIGTDKTGTVGIGNGSGWPGIDLLGGAHHNTVGGTTAAARNVISGNTGRGVVIRDAGTNGNVLVGNYIGLNAAGNAIVANGFYQPANHFFAPGIEISFGAQDNVIGGTSPGSGNVISGNAAGGIFINSGTAGTLVRGNLIGTDPAGSAAMGNGFADVANNYRYSGILIYGAQSNIIGGTVSGAGNVVSGNAGAGITIDGGSGSNLVQGNLIGTNASGTSAIANYYSGVSIQSSPSNTIGGLTTGARNIISGNTQIGIYMNDPRSTLNLVQGNYIGLNSAGSFALPNGAEGVYINGGAYLNTIGGTTAVARNVISGNGSPGVSLFDAGTSNNLVQGNYIGLDATGTIAVGNTFSGVACYFASNNTIGGTTPGARNYISGNANHGVTIAESTTIGNLIQGNTIGLNVNGAAVPNLNQGVVLFNGAHANTIGGTAIGASNIISGNTNEGIALYDSSTIQNTISGNSIFANSAKGIVLITGSNNSQVYPTALSGSVSTAANPNGTDVSGSFAGGASTLEFFASPTADPSGFGEGQFFIGSLSVAGSGPFTAHLPAIVPAGYVIAATATANGNTSEFSQTFTVPAYADNGSDGTPDQWMLNHFTHTDPRANDLSRATDDADGDGMTNLQEFLAGTDPKDPKSRFAISIDRSAGNPRINLTSVAGKTYRLEYRDDLIAGSWNTLIDEILGSGAVIQIVDPSASGLNKRFYRAVVIP